MRVFLLLFGFLLFCLLLLVRDISKNVVFPNALAFTRPSAFGVSVQMNCSHVL